MGHVRDNRVRPGEVTAATLLTAVTDLHRDISTVLTKVEVMEAGRRADAERLADHESRLRVIQDALPPGLETRLIAGEKWRWQVAGVLAVVALVASVLSGWVSTLLAHAHP